MITECTTREEYVKKISELRKERDILMARADAIDREMDSLEVNSKIIDFIPDDTIYPNITLPLAFWRCDDEFFKKRYKRFDAITKRFEEDA